MTNPQYTLTVALGVGPEGEKRRELYEKAAGARPLSQWVREALDKAAERVREAKSQCDLAHQEIEIIRAEGYKAGQEDMRERAAKAAENTPIDILRSQSHEGLRLSISDEIRSLPVKEKP